MSRFVFKLPDVGEGTAEAEIVKWHAKVGDHVGEEQPLVDVMTDKATVEIASPVSGRIVLRNGEEGSKAAVGSELVVFDVMAEGEPAMGEAQKAPPVAAPAVPVSPAVTVAQSKPAAPTAGKSLASPAVRARATALGLDMSAIAGSGPQGGVTHQDLDTLLTSRQAGISAPASASHAAPRRQEEVEDIKVFGLRRRIAERMLESKRTIPHFAFVEEVDVTELESLRRELNTSLESRHHLTLLPFLIRALTKSIGDHPGVNAHYDDEQGVIRRFKAVHAGIATQTSRGLLVPVIRHAEEKDVWQLAAEVARLSEAARSGKANREELSGSTITVTSLGALGGIAATPIINPPEVGIIGVNRMAERPMVRNGAIVIRKMMNLSSSFDHRIVDGYEAAAFIKSIKNCLEAPAILIVAQ